MTLVVDASAVVTGLVDGAADGEWAAQHLRDEPLAAPGHMLIEVSNVLRRAVLAGSLGRDVATLVHDELPRLRVTTFGFELLALRVGELHPDVTAYDAAYVALAELLDAPLLTLDRRLARAAGPTCTFLTPPT